MKFWLKNFFLVSLSLNLAACRSEQKFEQKILENKCEDALEDLPENQTGYKLISKTQELSGLVLSYSATGAAYTVQVLWDVTATVGSVTILCAPTIAVVAASKENGHENIQPYCFTGDIKKIQAPYLGKETYKNTESWRCPDVDTISRSIRKVAHCYLERDGQDNRNKALSSLKSVEKSGTFYQCLSNKERESFLKDLAAANAD